MNFDEPDTIEEMIPLYAAGTLSEEGCKAVEAAIARRPALKRDLEYFQSLKGAYSALGKDIPPPSPDLFDRIQKKIESSSSAAKTRAPQMERPSIWHWLGSAFQMPRLAWGVAVAQLLIILALLISSPSGVQYQTLSGNDTQSTAGGYVNVVFHPNTPELAIRRALVEAGAVIVDGPNADGLYRLKVDTVEAANRVSERLMQSDIVRFAAPAP